MPLERPLIRIAIGLVGFASEPTGQSFSGHSLSGDFGWPGAFTAVLPMPELERRPSARLSDRWIDDPALEWREGVHLGAKTVNQWRREFLADSPREFSDPPHALQPPNHEYPRK